MRIQFTDPRGMYVVCDTEDREIMKDWLLSTLLRLIPESQAAHYPLKVEGYDLDRLDGS